MKIVLVNTQTPGGAYVACQRLYNALKKQGVDVSFVAIKKSVRQILFICIGLIREDFRCIIFSKYKL